MLRFCQRQSRRWAASPEDAQDVAQDAALRAWRMRHQCRSPDRPWAWLARIVQREAARHAGRRRELSVADPESALPAAGGNDDDDATDRLTAQSAVSALGALDRRLISLRYGHDQTTARIAELVGMPEGTVKVRLHRARKRLRADLEDVDTRL